MSVLSTLSRKIQSTFQPQAKREDPLIAERAKLNGAFINQGNIQNLQVTIKNYNCSSEKDMEPDNSDYSQTNEVKDGNFDRITVIKNMYYES